jgi:hypothetical protein
VSRPKLLLVPFVTELEWEKIRPSLEAWGELATYDAPGVGGEPLPAGVEPANGDDEREAADVLSAWREATARRGIEEVDRREWSRFFIATDSYGIATGVRTAEIAADRVAGIAIGHAALSQTREGDRPAASREIFEAMGALLRADREAFIAHGIAQMTQGSIDDELAKRWLERFPEAEIVNTLWDALGHDPEPIGERLERLGLPLLLGQHVGCLARTEEGFEDIVAAFPDAATVRCEEACLASPAFAAALRDFCSALAD